MLIKHMRLGRNPEAQKTNSGGSVVNISAAYDTYTGKDKDGKDIYKTTWVQVSAFDRNAEKLVRFGKQGSYFKFAGEIYLDDYPKKDGSGTGFTLRMKEAHVDFPEIRYSNQNAEGGNGQSNQANQSKPASTKTQTPSKPAEEEVFDENDSVDVFDEFFGDYNKEESAS